MRMLKLPDDPRCVAVLEEHQLADVAKRAPWDLEPALRAAVEALVARELAPPSWLEDERIASLMADPRSALLALRNVSAVVTAEGILREALAGTRGRYAGLREYTTLQHDEPSSDQGGFIPSPNPTLGIGTVTVAPKDRLWLEATRGTETKYHEPGRPMAWRCADHILNGPDWLVHLYETGLGLWCWRENLDASEWVLVVRKGEGFAWPTFEPRVRHLREYSATVDTVKDVLDAAAELYPRAVEQIRKFAKYGEPVDEDVLAPASALTAIVNAAVTPAPSAAYAAPAPDIFDAEYRNRAVRALVRVLAHLLAAVDPDVAEFNLARAVDEARALSQGVAA